MSFKSMKAYNVRCDRCGAELYDDIWWGGETAEDDLRNEGWITHKRKHYCTDCWEYDDNDNIVIKQPINEDNQ